MKKIVIILLSVLLLGFSSSAGITTTEYHEAKENLTLINKLENLKNDHGGSGAGKYVLNAKASVMPVERLSKDEVTYIAVSEMNCGVSINNYYSLENSFIVTDFSDNEYLFTAFNPYGSSVISMYNYTTVEVNYFDEDDYSGFTDADGLKYIPSAGLYKLNGNPYDNVFIDRSFSTDYAYIAEAGSSKYIKYMNTKYDTSINQKISLLGGGGGNGNKNCDVDVNSKVVTADIEIPHSWFFKFNKTQFSYSRGGANGICEYIAFLMIMSYHDFFSSAGYFSDGEIATYVSAIQGNSFESAIPNISDNWCYDLYQNNNCQESLSADNLNGLASKFLANKGENHHETFAYWILGNPRDVIENGKRPDMMSAYFPNPNSNDNMAHNIIAYGAFTSGAYKDKYLTHYGWNGHTQCIVERPFSSMYDWSVKNYSDHVHRYIFNINGVMRCGCEY